MFLNICTLLNIDSPLKFEAALILKSRYMCKYISHRVLKLINISATFAYMVRIFMLKQEICYLYFVFSSQVYMCFTLLCNFYLYLMYTFRLIFLFPILLYRFISKRYVYLRYKQSSTWEESMYGRIVNMTYKLFGKM